jgi:hypothetical protein
MSPAASQIRAIRMCNGGESVDNGNAQTMCSYCSGGVCVQWQACEVPEPFPVPDRWTRFVSRIEQAIADWKRGQWRKHRRASIQTPFD